MKKVLLAVFLVSCYTVKQAHEDALKHKNNNHVGRVSYTYVMIKPVNSDQLSYDDSNISAKFIITPKDIDFNIKNITAEPLKIIWDEASIGWMGISHRVIHAGVRFIDRDKSMPPTIILPNTSIEETTLPSDNVYLQSSYYTSDWSEKPLVLERITKAKDSTLLNALKGQVLTLYLPIKSQSDNQIGYTFQFEISSARIQ